MESVIWKPSTSGSPHAIIVGIPGQGKSVTTRNIIRQFAVQSVPTLTFDFHGDMANEAPKAANIIDVGHEGLPFNPFELRASVANSVKLAALEIADIFTVVGSLGEIQRNHVYQAILQSYEQLGWADSEQGGRLPSMGDFVTSLRSVEEATKGKNAEARLLEITEFGLFNPNANSTFAPLFEGGTVFKVDTMGTETIKVAAGAFLLRKIYNDMFAWGQTDRIRLAIVLDEAHLLAGDLTIPKLMKEGRKFGISLLLVSQSLDDFRPGVVENTGMKIVFRLNHPSSRKAAALLDSRDAGNVAITLERLQVGEAMVSLAEYPVPAKVRMQGSA
jgi:DNA phosphorothioation-dependent restriction protein DptH